MRPGAGGRDDAALLRDVARSDEGALAALCDRHAGWLIVRMTRRRAMHDVVDHAIQDTFLAVVAEAGSYRGRSHFVYTSNRHGAARRFCGALIRRRKAHSS
jgi:DNA-directed RNA polymerase specialized sigma24 family protein